MTIDDNTRGERNRAGGFLERLARQIGSAVGATTVFAPEIQRDGLTVIPVATVAWGFGGGSRGLGEAATGGGGAMRASPVGYIEIKDGASAFRPIVGPVASPVERAALVLAGGALGLLALRVLSLRR